MVHRLHLRRNAIEKTAVHGRLRNRLNIQNLQGPRHAARAKLARCIEINRHESDVPEVPRHATIITHKRPE